MIPESEAAFRVCSIKLLAEKSGFITRVPWKRGLNEYVIPWIEVTRHHVIRLKVTPLATMLRFVQILCQVFADIIV